jgi:hypothetical protein
MHAFNCDGLRAENPIGAMAAFGLLRVCSARPLFGEARLSWRSAQGAWRAVLHTERRASMDELIHTIRGVAGEVAARPEFNWAPEIKSANVEDYRREAVSALAARDGEALAWFAAFGSEFRSKDGVLEPTPFDMTVARQRFLADAVRLSELIRGPATVPRGPTASYQEALLGPWLYQDDQHSLGWDPVAMRLGAFTNKEPSKMKNEGVRAAVWLAFQSLPFFPCCYANRSLAARGWVSSKAGQAFTWPVWTAPVAIATLEQLLGLSELGKSPIPMHDLQLRGVVAVYRSRRVKPNKYMTTLEPSEPCPGSIPPSEYREAEEREVRVREG